MQKVNLRKNIALFKDSSFLVVGDRSEKIVSYVAKLLDLEADMEVVIIDPSNNQSYQDLQNDNCRLIDKYNQMELESMLCNWSYSPPENGIIMILNNCFPRRNHENLYIHETEILFRRAKALNIRLIVTLKKLIMPHNYYRFFDFLLVGNPGQHKAKITSHFPCCNEGTDISVSSGEYLFVDNRTENINYYVGTFGEIENDGDVMLEVHLEDVGDCCVCLTEYSDGQVLIQCRNCSNYGHQECLLQWYEHNATCPLCRSGCRLNRKFIYRVET